MVSDQWTKTEKTCILFPFKTFHPASLVWANAIKCMYQNKPINKQKRILELEGEKEGKLHTNQLALAQILGKPFLKFPKIQLKGA